MKRLFCAVLALLPAAGFAMGEDDPLLFMFKLDQLEVRDADGANPLVWEGYAWLGKDLNKLYLNTEGERVDGEYEELSTELLYSRAVAPYWDVQMGWRHDTYPEPSRDWLAVGVQGLAPYFFETDATFYLGQAGRTALKLKTEYELMFTQRLVLIPELEANFYGKSDAETGAKAGLSDISAGLRLGYEIRREFAPYIGVNWGKSFGGEGTSDWQAVAGIRLWF